MNLETTLKALRAAGDGTRLRVLAALLRGEATVGELQSILDQSQPRVSRHLRILAEAGLVEKYRDGHWVYYRMAESDSRSVIEEAVSLIIDDEQIEEDRAMLDQVKQAREREVLNDRGGPADRIAQRPDSAALALALDECTDHESQGDVLDVGCGSGGLLLLLGKRARQVVGIDRSRRLRLLARSRIHRAGLTNCAVRDGSKAQLPVADDSFDLVVLNEVTGRASDLRAGLVEAARVLRPDGRLLIVDRIQPVARRLPAETADNPLIDNQLTATLGEIGYRVAHRYWFPGRIMEYAMFAAVPGESIRRTDNSRTGTHG